MADNRPIIDQPVRPNPEMTTYKEVNPQAVDQALHNGVARQLSNADPAKTYSAAEVQAVPPTPFQVMIGTEDNKPVSTEALKETMPQSFASPESNLVNHMIQGNTRTTDVIDFNDYKKEKAAKQQRELEKLKEKKAA